MNHLYEFNRAWDTPEFTQIELDPVDINAVIKDHYSHPGQFSMTKTQLWDMEVKKASRPDLFIPSVIKRGSAAAWGFKTQGNSETFTRVSEQRLWLDNTQYGVVIEHVHIDHDTKLVTFIGELQVNSDEYGHFIVDGAQPIFHVQHGVVGDENSPINTWKIVHLEATNEAKLKERFQKMNHCRWLPEYVEIYLRDILGVELQRGEF
ncbi:hypothetical protein PA25_03170 [Pseudoalteromonas sp. A25]|uniref:hypothetical protein n=1 Tax=Pseudoalteromonas sp. A25 TaxID=116092 RepID=UPI001260D33F|nr:hypothetical protein [Pseudoalteromonas sp. A25]BBN80332.1 hypothetical protein PA25_03170 [Pseudoalteromonas sp. A25]